MRQATRSPTRELKKLDVVDTSYEYGFIELDAVVSTSGDQVAIGSGEMVKQWTDNDRNYFHYKSDRPMPFRFAFSSARYKIRKDNYKNIPIEVYYDKRHAANVDSLIANAKRTLDYCESNFGNYPHKTVRFAEVSDFAEGFAATAYPGVIYMKEIGGFYNNINKGNQQDIINQLAGHELSHQWWGSAQLAPAHMEGGWILTETLAKYTELMLYQRARGLDASLEIVREHVDQYLSNRGFSVETPLYRTTYETPHLPYNKGTVVMHQLHQLVGEDAINTALKAFLAGHAYPGKPPTSEDLLKELYRVSPPSLHGAIDELFKEIIIYDMKMEEVSCSGNEVSFKASVKKYREDGNGKRTDVPFDNTIDIGVYTEDGKVQVQPFSVVNKVVTGKMKFKAKPVKLVIDPYLKKMDSFLKVEGAPGESPRAKSRGQAPFYTPPFDSAQGLGLCTVKMLPTTLDKL
jgi:ABC-2 type transport system permease protein